MNVTVPGLNVPDADSVPLTVRFANVTLLLLTVVTFPFTMTTFCIAVAVAALALAGNGFVVAALVNVLRGWRQDLVEARRRLRALIVILCGGYRGG